MNINLSTNFENIVYVYLNKNIHLYPTIEEEFFKNPYIRALVKLSKEFYNSFKEPMFNTGSPNIGQIQALVMEDKKSFLIDKNMSDDQNISTFLSNVDYVIKTDLNNYSEDWLEQTIGMWITWQNNQMGYKRAIQYQQTQVVTPENVMEIITKAKDIVMRCSNIQINDEEIHDFFDPKSHKQIPLDNLIDSGYASINKFVCGFPNGGFIPATLSIFVGASNSGKSVILGNVAKNIAFSGKNVLFVSLEMSISRTYRRIGSNTFDIPMSDYDRFAADEELLQAAMNEAKANNINNGVPVGKFIGVKYAKATPSKIYSTAKKLEEKFGIKWHAIVIDYFTELDNDYGISQDKMYIYHKQNANDLFAMASETDWAVITAHQMRIGGYNKSDIDLSMLGESSGIIHRTDSIIGMITSDQMQIEKCMYMKNLKARESNCKDHYAKFTTQFDKMRIIESGDTMPPENYQTFNAVVQ